MFDEVLREIRGINQGERVPLVMELDDDEYFDRVCPNPLCTTEFKVYFPDWREKVSDESVHCPICGFVASSDEWNTTDQAEQIKAVALLHIHKRLNDAFDRDINRFNQSHKSDEFIKTSMSYRPCQPPILISAKASEIMRQKYICEICGCRYSSIGAAFFCPACGHNSAKSTFDNTIETVRKAMEALPEIKRTLAEVSDRDKSQDTIRFICENSMVKVVSAYQRLAEVLYDTLSNDGKPTPRRNVFQNLQESSELWRSTIGAGYDQMIVLDDLQDLERFFQQRHLLVHKDGIIDQAYLDKSREKDYSLGQRLVIRPDAVERISTIVSTLANELRKRISDA